MKFVYLLIFFVAFASPLIAEEEPAELKGSWNFGIWGGGGSGLSGTTKDSRLVIGGFEYGKMMTGLIGTGAFRGNLEAAVEIMPGFLVSKDGETVYGLGLTPFLFRWNFLARPNIIPYAEAGLGFLFSESEVPPGTSKINFTPQAAFGLYIAHRDRSAVRFSARYMHISNGGLQRPNPGINSLQFLVGYHWFSFDL